MNKKIFTILVLVIVVASISAVSAFELGDIFGSKNSEQVTIGGINFTIPEGYKEVEQDYMNELNKNFSQPGYNVEGKAFKKDSTDVVIVVGTHNETRNLTELGNKTTISGIEGYAAEEDNNTYVFSYVDDKKLVTFSTSDKNAIADFIIA